jgi:hypothetical protein
MGALCYWERDVALYYWERGVMLMGASSFNWSVIF